MRRSKWAGFCAALVLLAACSDDGSGSDDTTAATEAAPVDSASGTTDVAAVAATFELRPGVEILAVTEAEPGAAVEVASGGEIVATGTVDEQGAFLARDLDPGPYVVTTDGATERQQSDPAEVLAPDDHPDASFYESQQLPAGGFGYVTTRDGTTLSINVSLPGPADGGPYPTVVEYSGYDPSNPANTTFAQLFNSLGYAYVGVNMRGTGCSGGTYEFFQPAQNTDGYDAIEAVAAQPWVQDHEVGMVGISYPGITQLFVAQTQPPSLAAITPLSVIDDLYRSTLYPGGILNTGFAVPWLTQRLDQAKPSGQQWAADRIAGGDETCQQNQELRLQNPDLLSEVEANPTYDPDRGDPLAPIQFVDQIDVPVFLAGAWQDEQTGGHFPAMVDSFTSSPLVDVSLVNGLHTESILPGVFQRYLEFLDLYVAKRTPSMAVANIAAPILTSSITGTSTLPPFEDRFAGQTYEQAKAAFEAEDRIHVLFEEGAADGLEPGSPWPRFVESFSDWPIPEAQVTRWYLGPDGTLTTSEPAADGGEEDYTADPAALPSTFYEGSGSGVWQADVEYQWLPLPDGSGLGYVTAPLTEDLVVAGPGSVDLWISSTTDDTDLEVTISEVRPDGQEVYVQSGWLRASHRALDEALSTELRPVQTHLTEDVKPLPGDGKLEPVRVELFPFAHVFRAGSQLRLTIDAPGNNRAIWAFDTISDGETVTVAHDADHPSSLVLGVLPDVTAPAGAPACGSLRGQPCRGYQAASNGG